MVKRCSCALDELISVWSWKNHLCKVRAAESGIALAVQPFHPVTSAVHRPLLSGF